MVGQDDATTTDEEKDPEEQAGLARDLGDELTEIFVSYARGQIDFADLTFLTFETLQDLHIIASGAYELEDDDGDDDATYDRDEATDSQEDLAQEPAGA